VPKTNDELKKIHSDSIKEFDKIQSAVRYERRQCLEDRRFYSIAGAQWEDELGKQFKNKPRFEVNKIHLSVIRIISEWRNNRITVDFVDKFGSGDEALADILDGLYRATEKDSGADEAYDNAFEEAVGGGMGAYRLRSHMEDEYDDENEYQQISIEPIYDADSCVFFDLDAKRQDKSDAKSCYVLYSMTHDSYMEQYPKGGIPSSWDKDIEKNEFDWVNEDFIYVCEKYQVEEKIIDVFTYRYFDDKEVKYREIDFENDPDLKVTLKATGAKKVKTSKVKIRRVHKYLMSGIKVLEDQGEIAGPNIPIVPVYGKRWFVDNIERCMGHVRLAKDSQRLKNMQFSKLAEIAAYSSVEKPIFLPEQITRHKNMWEEDNVLVFPYLMVDAIKDKDGIKQPLGPVQYTKSPDIPPALAQLLALTEVDLKELTGNQEKAEQVVSNISGKVIEQVKENLDMQTFIYLSNMSKGIKRGGDIWQGMAREIYVETGREMKSIGSDGKSSKVVINQQNMDDEAGKELIKNNISRAKYEVVADVGPSSRSKRDSTVNDLIAMLQYTQDPEIAKIISHMIMMHMDVEGVDNVRDFFRMNLIKMKVIPPTDEEKAILQKEAETAPPDPNTEFLLAEAEKAKANANKAASDIEVNQAKIKQMEAKIKQMEVENIETLSEIDRKDEEGAEKGKEKNE